MNQNQRGRQMPCQQPAPPKRPIPRAQLLNYINEVSFAVVDLSLYLDTHPGDQKALAFFEEVSERRRVALKEYAKHHGPLTIDTANDTDSDSWEWVNQPWPWEGGNC